MIANLKNRLLCLGMRVPGDLKQGRKWGAGPAGGRYVLMGESIVNVPIFGFAEVSSIRLVEVGKKYYVVDSEKKMRVGFLENPKFYELLTTDGVPMRKIALAHGRDCLGSTVHQKCIRWRQGEQCHFCGIELSLKHATTIETKTPDNLAEVAAVAEREGFNHITLTTGTPNLKDKGARILSYATKAVKENTKMLVHVQLEPVGRKDIESMHSAGADSIGIHIESLDRSTLRRVCPGKVGDWDDYFRAWKDSLDVFGPNQVSSYVILGLGEKRDETLAGIGRMCEEGVIPYIVPLRPLEETLLQDSIPPSPEIMEEIYAHTCEKMREYGIDPTKNLAGCVRCEGCSALSDFYRG
ncbi:MAG: MSMEG_0568 family radical SAM protein [Thermoplasmata archaeon]